jgi:hypothetical protein
MEAFVNKEGELVVFGCDAGLSFRRSEVQSLARCMCTFGCSKIETISTEDKTLGM